MNRIFKVTDKEQFNALGATAAAGTPGTYTAWIDVRGYSHIDWTITLVNPSGCTGFNLYTQTTSNTGAPVTAISYVTAEALATGVHIHTKKNQKLVFTGASDMTWTHTQPVIGVQMRLQVICDGSGFGGTEKFSVDVGRRSV